MPSRAIHGSRAPLNPPPLHQAGAGKHLHLTAQQREVRKLTALHEAAHFVVGVALGAGFNNVFIRVSGRTPKSTPGHGGQAGFANVHASQPADDAMVTAAAVLTEFALDPSNWENRAASDIQRLEEWRIRNSISDHSFNTCMDRALCAVVKHWPAIDGAAAAFLELCDSTGVVKRRQCAKVAQWIRGGTWGGRPPAVSLPRVLSTRAAAITPRAISYVAENLLTRQTRSTRGAR